MIVASPSSAGARTETARAAAAMTPQTRALLPDTLLDARVGRGTLAGALNDQVRFRIDRTPGADPRTWRIVPDTKLAADLVASRAGEGLLRQLRTAIDSTGSLGATSNLQGFMLPDDLDSLLAARALSSLADRTNSEGRDLARLGAAGDTARAAATMQSWRDDVRGHSARAGAWNNRGWITFAPHTARAMLVAAGAYAPDRAIEPGLLQAEARTTYLSGNAPHEVQHSVTPRPIRTTARWMEEGIANVFARTPVFHARNARRAGLTPERYASQLSHAPWFSTGWSAYVKPKLTAAEQKAKDDAAKHDYADSQVVLRDLARMAGADFRSSAGQQRAFDLLQGASIHFVPGRLADAIIERHGLDPSVRERLRERIAVAVDLPGGARAIADEFGIGT